MLVINQSDSKYENAITLNDKFFHTFLFFRRLTCGNVTIIDEDLYIFQNGITVRSVFVHVLVQLVIYFRDLFNQTSRIISILSSTTKIALNIVHPAITSFTLLHKTYYRIFRAFLIVFFKQGLELVLTSCLPISNIRTNINVRFNAEILAITHLGNDNDANDCNENDNSFHCNKFVVN